jgi:hypothetical protein
VYDDLNEGNKVKATTILDLIQKYPKFTSQLTALNNSKESSISITEALFNVEKSLAVQKANELGVPIPKELDGLTKLVDDYKMFFTKIKSI